MIIEMTYKQWRDIYAVLGRERTELLNDDELSSALILRSRINDYQFEN